MVPQTPRTQRAGHGPSEEDEEADTKPSASPAGEQHGWCLPPASTSGMRHSGVMGLGSTRDYTISHTTVVPESADSAIDSFLQQLGALHLEKTSAALSKIVWLYHRLTEHLHQKNNRGEDVASAMQLVTKCHQLMERRVSCLDWHTLCLCTSVEDRVLLMSIFPNEKQKRALSTQKYRDAVQKFMCCSPPAVILKDRAIKEICIKISPILVGEGFHTTEQWVDYLLLHYGARNVFAICQRLSRHELRQRPPYTALQNTAQSITEAFMNSEYPPPILCAAYYRSLLAAHQTVSASLESISATLPLTHQQASALCSVLEKCNQLTLTVQDLSRLTPTERKHHFMILSKVLGCLHKMNGCHITKENIHSYCVLLKAIRCAGYSRIKEAAVPLLEMCLACTTLQACDCLARFLSTTDGEQGVADFLDMMTALVHYTELLQEGVEPGELCTTFAKILQTVTVGDTDIETAHNKQAIGAKKNALLKVFDTYAHAFPVVRATNEQNKRITAVKNCLIHLLQYYDYLSLTVQEIETHLTSKEFHWELQRFSAECAEKVSLFIGGIVLNGLQYIHRACHVGYPQGQKLLLHWNTTQNRQSPFTPENSLICQREIAVPSRNREWLPQNGTTFIPLSDLCEEVRGLFSTQVAGVFVDCNFCGDLHRDIYAINGCVIEKDDQRADTENVNGTSLSMLEPIILALFRSGATEEAVRHRLLSISRLAHQGMAAVLLSTVSSTTLFHTTCPTKIEIAGGGAQHSQEYDICISPARDVCRFKYLRQRVLISSTYQAEEVADQSCIRLRKVTYDHGYNRRGVLLNNQAFTSLLMDLEVGSEGFIKEVQQILYIVRMFVTHTDENSTVYMQRGMNEPAVFLEERSALCTEKIL